MACLVVALWMVSAMVSAIASTTASAQDATEPDAGDAAPPTEAELAEARHSFDVASSAFEIGDYETAAAEFRAAYALMRHPDLLFNVYLAEERAGRPQEALDALEQYLAHATLGRSSARVWSSASRGCASA